MRQFKKKKIDWQRFFDETHSQYGSSIRACGFHTKSFYTRQKNIFDWVKPIENKKILDIGCGPGLFIDPIAKDNLIVGMDISRSMLTGIACPVQPVQADMRHLPFSDRAFDYIFCIETLQCLQGDVKGFLKEVNRVLTPGGTFICSTLNKDSLVRTIHSLFADIYKCLNLIGMSTLKEELILAGFGHAHFLLDYYPVLLRKKTDDPGHLDRILSTSYAVMAEKLK